MGRLLPNIAIRSTTAFAAMILAVLCVLATPQQANAYSCWYKLYDVDGNLIYAYDNDDGVTACVESVDVNKLQQGVKFEFFYDGGDGDPLPSVSSMAFDVKIFDASVSATPNYGLKDAAAMKDYPVETEISGGSADPEGPLSDGGQGFFIGTIKTSGTLLLKAISPDTNVSFQISCLPYVHGVGGNGKNAASVATYMVAASSGDGNKVEEGENSDESGITNADDTTGGPQGSTSKEDDSANQQESSDVEGRNETKEEKSGASNIAASEENATGKQTDSDQKRRETVAASVAESNDERGNKTGDLITWDTNSGSNVAEKTPTMHVKRADSVPSAFQSDSVRGSAHMDSSRLSDMGTLFEVSESVAEEQPSRFASDSKIELSGVPYAYLALMVLLVMAMPVGVLKKRAFGKRGLGEGSRLLDV